MTQRGRNLLMIVLFTLLVVAVGAWWLSGHELVEVDQDAPLQGEAAYNPLYALKKTLQASGHEVSSRARLDFAAMTMGDHDTLVLGSDVRTLSEAQVDAVLDWMGNGGRLLFAVPPGVEGRDGDLIEALGIKRGMRMHCVDMAESAVGQTRSKANMRPDCFRTFTFDEGSDENFDLLVGDAEKGYFMGRRFLGKGSWTVIGDLQFLDNQHLSKARNAQLSWQLLAPLLQGGRVHLVYASSLPPLHVLLARHAWQALVPALLALLAWLWLRSRRLGPLLPAPVAPRRALREHIDAAGEFIIRQRKASALYAPLRRAFDERLRLEDPAVAALDGEDLIAAVAKLRGRPIAFVRQALQPADINRSDAFLQTVKALDELGLR
ncbi:DUF4350 domain-containing protein [Dokdonella sp.]|uniref:DUF4350 domain-containing protein n=1 Tax=Dokdonella sp. TaxID=2291710 RepID=UPI0025B9C00A|nr:DUF4350 domain-containing protein [Dokdonella sp.]MBX3688828.1 DUF4350 domain-containing protein [Dokdonella sp.]